MKSEQKPALNHSRITALAVAALSSGIMILAILLCSCLCIRVSAAQTPEAERKENPQPELVEKLISPLLKHSNGALVLGFTDGSKHQIFAYGRQTDAEQTKVDGNTIFELGSLTKVFTSLLLADLWRDNKLSFDDPVRKFLQADTNVPDYHGKQMTLFELATHTSGLPRDPDNHQAHSAPYSKEQFHAFLQRCRLRTAPGNKYFYSNAGFTLLGEVLEKAGQGPFWSLLKERILDPLRLKDTMIVLDESRLTRLAQGHDKTGQALQNSPTTGGAAGGLKSTANDLLLLLDESLKQQNTTTGLDIAETCKRRFKLDRAESACLGWFYNSVTDSFGKSGQIDGFSSCIEFSPSRHYGIVVLSSTLQLEAAPILRRCAALCRRGAGSRSVTVSTLRTPPQSTAIPAASETMEPLSWLAALTLH